MPIFLDFAILIATITLVFITVIAIKLESLAVSADFRTIASFHTIETYFLELESFNTS